MNYIHSAWLWLAITASVTFALTGVLQKVSINEEETDPISYSVFILLLEGLLTLPLAAKGFSNIPQNPNAWLVLILSSIVCACGSFLYFYTLKRIELSQINIISSSTSLWTLFLAVVLLGESLTLTKVLGVCLIVFSIAMIYWEKNSLKNFGTVQLLAVGYAASFGVTETLDKYLLNYFDVALYSLLVFWVPAAITIVFKPGSLKGIVPLLKPNKSNLYTVISAVLLVISNLSAFYALKVGGQASEVGPIWNSAAVLTVLLSILILKERDHIFKKITATLIVFIGVILIGG